MLRINTSYADGFSATHAKTYFNEEFSREGYYSNSYEKVGVWGGKGAEKLGLSGDVKKEDFHALCDNLHPATSSPLTQRLKANRRVGYDINFHVPKSITLAYEYLQDKRVAVAFEYCYRETMRRIETAAAARVRIGGKDEDRNTAVLVWGEFQHFTTRPVGGIPDPHLHAHCFVFNATFDEVEGRWKAGQFFDICKDAPYYEAVFHALLAAKLRALGYETVKVGNSFELVGVSRELIEKFSRRSEVIEAKAAELGATTAKRRDTIGSMTREKKVRNIPRGDLEADWWGRLAAEDKTALMGLRGASKSLLKDNKNAEAVDFAIKHTFERKSVVSEKQLYTEALRWGVGHVQVAETESLTEKRDELLWTEAKGKKYVSTQKVWDEEDLMIGWGKSGKGVCHSINPKWKIEDDRLNADQRKAIAHVLNSKDLIIGIQGKAGTGKTTLMVEAARAIRDGGKKLLVVAPTSKAARDVLRAEGFPEADTVAQLLASPPLQELARGGVLWIDEAGLLSAPQMVRVAELAKKLDARVILSGDTGQHHSVERGNAFEILQKNHAVEVANVEKVMRQKGVYRKAVERIAAKDYEAAFEKIQEMGAFREFPASEIHGALAEDYLKIIKTRKSVIVVSPTHAEGRAVAEKIREKLKAAGMVEKERECQILRPLDFSDAQKADAGSYKVGQVLKLHRHAPGLGAAKQYAIERVEEDGVWVRNENKAVYLPYSLADRWSVYEPDKIQIGHGDKVRITANMKTEDGREITNGSIHTVKRFTKDGEIILENGAKLGKDFGYLTHGYAITSHAAQGQTVDCVLIAQSGQSVDAGDTEQAYVSLSRGKDFAHWYTNDLEALKEAASRSRPRASAHEMGFKRSAKETEPVETAEEKDKRLRGLVQGWLESAKKGDAENIRARAAEAKALRDKLGTKDNEPVEAESENPASQSLGQQVEPPKVLKVKKKRLSIGL